MTAAQGWPDAVWAVGIACLVLVSGVALRAAGRWLQRSMAADFTRVVREATAEDLDAIQTGIATMRTEQTEQHAQVRADVQALAMRLDLHSERLDRIESRVYPPATHPGD